MDLVSQQNKKKPPHGVGRFLFRSILAIGIFLSRMGVDSGNDIKDDGREDHEKNDPRETSPVLFWF